MVNNIPKKTTNKNPRPLKQLLCHRQHEEKHYAFNFIVIFLNESKTKFNTNQIESKESMCKQGK